MKLGFYQGQKAKAGQTVHAVGVCRGDGRGFVNHIVTAKGFAQVAQKFAHLAELSQAWQSAGVNFRVFNIYV